MSNSLDKNEKRKLKGKTENCKLSFILAISKLKRKSLKVIIASFSKERIFDTENKKNTQKIFKKEKQLKI